MTDMLKGNTDPSQNNWWSQYKLTDNGRRVAALKTGTNDQTQDLFAVGYVAPPTDPKLTGHRRRGVGRQQRRCPRQERDVLGACRAIWHAFMQT